MSERNSHGLHTEIYQAPQKRFRLTAPRRRSCNVVSSAKQETSLNVRRSRRSLAAPSTTRTSHADVAATNKQIIRIIELELPVPLSWFIDANLRARITFFPSLDGCQLQ
jgi:hypothetical protein